MKHIVVVLAFVVAVCAQRRCSTISITAWNGFYREVNYDANPGEIAYRFANISYDYYTKRIRVREFEDRNGERPEKIDKLYLYNEQPPIEYRVEGGQCEKRDVSDRPFDHFGVLDGATFYGVDYLGVESSFNGVKVDQFGMDLDNGGRYFASYAPLGSPECIPVLEAYMNLRSPYQDERYNVHYEFMNISLFVPHDAFDIPSVCLV